MKAAGIGFAIRQARRAQGLTQQQLAGEAGLSRTTLSQLENGVFPDLGIRKVQTLLDRLGLTLEVRPLIKERRPEFLKLAATAASVSYRQPLTEAELIGSLLSGKVPSGKRPHFRTLLEEASPALVKGLLEEMSQWTRPGKIEKNLEKIRRDLGSSQSQ
jgi:transcriptional regulator with XRE-family HTH domain